MNHLPKEWNLFFKIISHAFAPKTRGFKDITQFTQEVGFVVSNNLRINLERLIISKILENQSKRANFYLYPRFLQIVLNRKLNKEQLALLLIAGKDNPVELSSCVVMHLINSNSYVNKYHVDLTDNMHEYFNIIAQPVPPSQIQEQAKEVAKQNLLNESLINSMEVEQMEEAQPDENIE